MVDISNPENYYRQAVREKISQTEGVRQWKEDLSRLVRRAEIYRQLKSKIPLEEIKAVVRENEKNLGIGQLIDSLVSNEFTVSNKTALVAADLFRNLRKKFRFV